MKCEFFQTNKWLSAGILFLGAVYALNGQDSRERHYLYPVLQPSHEEKPKINGWANSRVTEKLNRGLTVVQTGKEKAYVNWRLLNSDPKEVSFNLYREEHGKPTKINGKPIVTTTDYVVDLPAKNDNITFFVVPLYAGKEGIPSEKVTLVRSDSPKNYRSIKLKGDYRPQRIAVADLNGDGALDFIVKQPDQGIDPGGQPNKEGLTYKVEAYLNDGTFLWQKDLGPGIEPGIWYSPMIVYDFNGDGKAEIALKTGPADARDANGRVLNGPEWCSILDGMTGNELCKVDWPERSWRFGDYNRNNRNQMGMAYLDGKTPFLLVARGTYRLMMVDAYQLVGNKLQKVWRWDGDEENPIIRHQGAHGMHCIDLDGDGRDEVMLGSVVLDDNGTALWSTGFGHPDKCFVGDLDPKRPGLEAFYVYEDWHDDGNGICMVDAKTGSVIWGIGKKTLHVGDGMVADILPEVPGLECFASEDPKGGSKAKYLLSAQGKLLATDEEVPGCRNWLFWDGDKIRETLIPSSDRKSGSFSIAKYKGTPLTNGIDGNVQMIVDLQGDWREELITTVPGEIRIYSTTLPAKDRRVSLLQDPAYRADIVHRSMGYDQSPMTSYYLGE